MVYSGSLSAFVLIVVRVGSAVAQSPDWYCYFDNGDCGIKQHILDSGSWKTNDQYLFAEFKKPSIYPPSVGCTLPLEFEETIGRLSLRHYSKNGWIEIRYCEDADYIKIEPSSNEGWNNMSHLIECSKGSKIDISIQAVRDKKGPDIRIDDIKVYKGAVPSTGSPLTSQKSTTGTSTSLVPTLDSTSSISSLQPYSLTSSSHITTTEIHVSKSHSSSGWTPPISKATTTVSSTSRADSTSPITGSHTSATSKGRPGTFETTASLTETTPNSTLPNPASQKGGPKAAIISVSIILVFLFVVTIAVILILHHRRVPQQNDPYVGPGKRFDDNVYTNAAFSAKDHVELNHPDVIRDAHLTNGLQTQHHPPSSTSPQGSSLHHLQQDDCNGYRGLDNSAMGQGDYMDLKHQGVVSHQAEEEGQEYFVLEGPGDEDSDGQHGTGTSSSDVDDQAYDHLNRGTGNGNIQNELREGHYGAAAVMSAEDEYNILVHGNEADINPTSSRPKPKEMAPQSGHGAGNEYQTLGLVDGNDPMKYDDTAENHYNVLGETDEDAVGSSANTPKDTGSSDDYHVLHSGKETGDYHLYQHPEQELSSGSPADSSKPEDEDYTYYYPVVDGQGNGVTKESLPQGEGDDYYSVVNVQGQMDTSGVAGDRQHEPIYSSDVYSELV